MFNEIILAIVQAATEFLPVSSSGHLAIISNILSSEQNLPFFTALHLASLLAVLIFTRKEIAFLLSFKKETASMWKYLIIATVPAALIGFLFHDVIASAFSSLLLLSLAFLFTSIILFLTKFTKETSKLDAKRALLIGLFQAVALFPGVSRSGMTVSAGLFSGIKREQVAKFSFLLFIPLAIGAFILEMDGFSFSPSILVAFIVCLVGSLLFLSLLTKIIQKGKLWWFSFYTLAVSILCFLAYIK